MVGQGLGELLQEGPGPGKGLLSLGILLAVDRPDSVGAEAGGLPAELQRPLPTLAPSPRAAASISGGPRTAEMTATAWAPARRTWATFSWFIPPIATMGRETAFLTRARVSTPMTTAFSLLVVGKIEPRAI